MNDKAPWTRFEIATKLHNNNNYDLYELTEEETFILQLIDPKEHISYIRKHIYRGIKNCD